MAEKLNKQVTIDNYSSPFNDVLISESFASNENPLKTDQIRPFSFETSFLTHTHYKCLFYNSIQLKKGQFHNNAIIYLHMIQSICILFFKRSLVDNIRHDLLWPFNCFLITPEIPIIINENVK